MDTYPEKSTKENIFDRLRKKIQIHTFLNQRAGVKEAEEARALIKEACAKAILLHGRKAYHDPQLLRPFLKDLVAPSSWMLTEEIGRRAMIERITQGGLSDVVSGPLNGDFVWGLRISGAIRDHKEKPSMQAIKKSCEAPLVEALDDSRLCYSLNTPYVSSPFLQYYPPETRDGPSVMAGLLAGAALVPGALLIPDTEVARSLLDNWSILYDTEGDYLRCSLFYGALLAAWMPAAFTERSYALNDNDVIIHCPFLSLFYWDFCIKGPYKDLLPTSNALPYGCCKRTFYKRGYERRELKRLGAELGIRYVAAPLREVIVAWWEQYDRDHEQDLMGVIRHLRIKNFPSK